MGTSREVYTPGFHDSVLRSHNWRTVQNSAAYLADDLHSGTRVLDIGCGPGTITRDIAERVAPAEVVGVDNADAPLAIAEAAADRERLDNLTFALASTYDLPYSAATFDVVHAHQVLQHLVDPVAALREMARVCRPGGIIAARDADYGGMHWYPAIPELDRWLELYRALARDNNAEPDAGRALKSWAIRAELTEIHCTASAWCHASEAERQWWGGLWAERATESAFATQVVERGMSDATELSALAAGWRTWAAAESGWFLAPHGEIRCVVR